MESLLEGFEKKQSRSSSAKVAFGHFPMSFTASSESGRRGILIHTKFANHVWASGGALAERTSFGSGKSRTGELSLDRIRAVFSKGADYCCELVWRRLKSVPVPASMSQIASVLIVLRTSVVYEESRDYAGHRNRSPTLCSILKRGLTRSGRDSSPGMCRKTVK
ncbi:uncharacterized protein LOC9631553 isoform X2 [Selaginella moellendorffii]|uniref:uncharacterized protein LOC9631553 isoform X2 n=1 Tax=Selaginella moellendorffii TaxID=88036 RepID=UPI000D1C5068|nr:uncharacterized protein LOC9631553 isoform X2 [Selaginella moellendorffii]|eukprot:XP_024520148.1 uncharacterized protein LOC9631553 isoform X2 [Selaginella moellendorffii]